MAPRWLSASSVLVPLLCPVFRRVLRIQTQVLMLAWQELSPPSHAPALTCDVYSFSASPPSHCLAFHTSREQGKPHPASLSHSFASLCALHPLSISLSVLSTPALLSSLTQVCLPPLPVKIISQTQSPGCCLSVPSPRVEGPPRAQWPPWFLTRGNRLTINTRQRGMIFLSANEGYPCHLHMCTEHSKEVLMNTRRHGKT